MGVVWEDGARRWLKEGMELVYGSLLDWVGFLFPGFFHSSLGMEPVFVFGLIGGAVMGL